MRIQIEVEWLRTLQEVYNLQVHLLESDIIDWQKDGTIDVQDYNHKHVLRKVVNGTYGKQLQAAVAGETETIEYITSFNPLFIIENMEIVAFVFDSDPASYEIIQGNAAHLIE